MAKNERKPANSPSKRVKILFTIYDISLADYYINHEMVINENSAFNYFLNANVNIIEDTSTIQIVIDYQFTLNDGTVLLKMKVENDFKIVNFKAAVPKIDSIDEGFLIFTLSLSLQQARGIQSTLIRNTPINHKYMPYLNKDEWLRKITINHSKLKAYR